MTRAEVAGILGEIALRKAWFPLAVFALHAGLARLVQGDRLPPPLDIPMHLLSGLALAYFLFGVVQVTEARLGRELMISIARPVMVFALVCTTAVFWEFGQFVWDQFSAIRVQHGLDDTLFDMFLVIHGGIAYVLWRVR